MLGGSGEDPNQYPIDSGFFSTGVDKVHGKRKNGASDRFEAGGSVKAARLESATILDEKTKRMWMGDVPRLTIDARTAALPLPWHLTTEQAHSQIVYSHQVNYGRVPIGVALGDHGNPSLNHPHLMAEGGIVIPASQSNETYQLIEPRPILDMNSFQTRLRTLGEENWKPSVWNEEDDEDDDEWWDW